MEFFFPKCLHIDPKEHHSCWCKTGWLRCNSFIVIFYLLFLYLFIYLFLFWDFQKWRCDLYLKYTMLLLLLQIETMIIHPRMMSLRASSSDILESKRFIKKKKMHEECVTSDSLCWRGIPTIPSAVSFLIQPTDPQPLPSGADQLSPFFWLALLGGWGKMTVTLAIDSALTHRAPTLPQTHWFLFWLSLENTKKVRPVQLWKMDGVSSLNGYQFTTWCFPREKA